MKKNREFNFNVFLTTRLYTLLEILGSMTNRHARMNMRSMISGVHLACEHKDQLFGLLMVIHLTTESNIEVIINLGMPGRLGSL